jgi:hypothetical protein
LKVGYLEIFMTNFGDKCTDVVSSRCRGRVKQHWIPQTRRPKYHDL